MSDRIKARVVAAGTSTFLTLLVSSVILLSVGVLAGRLTSPQTLPGGTTVTIALPALQEDVTPPPTGPGSIPPADGDGGFPQTPGGPGGPGGPGPGPGTDNPGEPEGTPAVGARVSGDVAGLGLIGADIPIRLGGAGNGETTTTNVDLLGLRVSVETSDTLVEDVLCLLICPPSD